MPRPPPLSRRMLANSACGAARLTHERKVMELLRGLEREGPQRSLDGGYGNDRVGDLLVLLDFLNGLESFVELEKLDAAGLGPLIVAALVELDKLARVHRKERDCRQRRRSNRIAIALAVHLLAHELIERRLAQHRRLGDELPRLRQPRDRRDRQRCKHRLQT
eukprot:Amastigsp_a511647_15.p2 type:complete len:163 gc:universal Amastigsp_a511647_15:54-542(+)